MSWRASRADRATLAADYAQTKTELDTRAKAIDAKRVEAMAEGKGVEGTLKEGRGPVYRQRMDELGKMQAASRSKTTASRTPRSVSNGRDAHLADQARAGVDRRRACQVQGRGRDRRASHQMAQDNVAGEDGGHASTPAACCPPSRRARTEFRQHPTPSAWPRCSSAARSSTSAMFAADVTKPKVRRHRLRSQAGDRGGSGAVHAAGRHQAFNANCVGGDKLAAQRSTDALFGFAVKCLSDSGLPSKQTDELRTKISYAEMNRDDKAHRFVVSLNAFQDGNRLAYLALAIAIGIDSLIFMTGLFGANAVRSPLADVPSQQGPQLGAARSHHRERAAARHARQRARHAQRHAPYHQRVGLHGRGAPRAARSAHRASRCWACSTPARPSARSSTTRRPIAISCARSCTSSCRSSPSASFEADKANIDLAELEKIVGVALLPDINQNAETVLHYMHPIDEKRGFTAEIKLGEVAPEHMRTVRSRSTPAQRSSACSGPARTPATIFIHRDLYKTLARIRARTLMADYGAPAHRQADRAAAPVSERRRTRPTLAHRAQARPRFRRRRGRRRPRSAAGFVTAAAGARCNIKPDAWERVSGPRTWRAVAANEAFDRARARQASRSTRCSRKREDEARTVVRRGLHGAEGQATRRRQLGPSDARRCLSGARPALASADAAAERAV